MDDFRVTDTETGLETYFYNIKSSEIFAKSISLFNRRNPVNIYNVSNEVKYILKTYIDGKSIK